MYILYTYISIYMFYIFKIYIFSIFFAYTKYIFLYLCILCIYFIHKIYISENIYKIYLAILAVYDFRDWVYLPLPSRDMTEITLKRRKILNQPNPTGLSLTWKAFLNNISCIHLNATDSGHSPLCRFCCGQRKL